ncbi:hypothetical protein B0O99DRAFT_669217 [Bisporella sp. PMI_857]|nr:hypothetical protein B0O99DRAFT_669217 [Bisporella sp. PMI_857]
MSTDPQTWDFPPRGAALPPIAQTSSFGPVHLGDVMILEWTPASETPHVYLWCLEPVGGDTVATIDVSNGNTSPYTFTHPTQKLNVNSSVEMFCHFSFLETELGNTVVWQFENELAAGGISTWAETVRSTSSSSVSSSTSTSTSTSSSSSTTSSVLSTTTSDPPALSQTGTSTSAPTNTATSSAQNKSESSSSGLSTGAKAGIGVGAAILALVLIVAAIFFVRRYKKKRPAIAELGGSAQYAHEAPAYRDGYTSHAGGVSQWKPPSQYQQPSELDAAQVQELDGRRL